MAEPRAGLRARTGRLLRGPNSGEKEEGGRKPGNTGRRGRAPHSVSVCQKARRSLRSWAAIWGFAGQHHASILAPQELPKRRLLGLPWGAGGGGAAGPRAEGLLSKESPIGRPNNVASGTDVWELASSRERKACAPAPPPPVGQEARGCWALISAPLPEHKSWQRQGPGKRGAGAP